MAILHQATLTPTKAELIAAWLPGQSWFDGDAPLVTPGGAYRFDDPAGEVGIESHIVHVGGRVVHVPLTYRGAELDGAEAFLVGTMEHSVLGTRWVYDAIGDPVYRAELVRVIAEADTQVDLFVETPDGPVRRDPNMQVRGSGGVVPDDAEIVVVREPLRDTAPSSGLTLTGTWAGASAPTVLAYLR
ncbi:hypothetical protein Xcel_1605 [Xylanimonas cellulosilytica DSM 15894]|uniref:Maltokinase N-terminal cap domain-containing protein n=1 Tax=Xylanimonas cellulosilytica (strain DSM 15894 / JCM 12276 / CECT 5975 / KCTC 9989 / LMG 20990 / NBRC 107835 / XIL07) TaxID=446471 RepID=D1BSD8_XYLCX|nr:hypothetical protein [Xylanimonas cellulosilytica]ACZ30630.1 hypothetical protein Xcel_1605 [Xylanimonas cellulosilytica DSM 15894]